MNCLIRKVRYKSEVQGDFRIFRKDDRLVILKGDTYIGCVGHSETGILVFNGNNSHSENKDGVSFSLPALEIIREIVERFDYLMERLK